MYANCKIYRGSFANLYTYLIGKTAVSSDAKDSVESTRYEELQPVMGVRTEGGGEDDASCWLANTWYRARADRLVKKLRLSRFFKWSSQSRWGRTMTAQNETFSVPNIVEDYLIFRASQGKDSFSVNGYIICLFTGE